MADLDVLVAGGGPAGLVTALYAQRAGLRVAVAEPREAPIDKACGEGLMPAAVRALTDLEVPIDGRTFRGIRYCDGTRSAVADFADGGGLGVRRLELHERLHHAVLARGIELIPRRVTDVEQDATGVRAAGVRARYLVAVDGLHSALRRELGLQRPPRGRPRWGIRAHYAVAPWTDHVEVHWAARCEAYMTPVGPDCVGVAVLGSDRAPLDRQLAAFAQLIERLPAAPVDRARGAGPLRQDVAGRVAGRVLLVGDAAGYVDALTGEGLALGFGCAQALVARLVAGNPAAYEGDYRRLSRRYRWITGTLLAAASRPALRKHLVPTAARAPALFRAAVRQLGEC